MLVVGGLTYDLCAVCSSLVASLRWALLGVSEPYWVAMDTYSTVSTCAYRAPGYIHTGYDMAYAADVRLPITMSDV